jgi:hypothetical protein
MTQYKAEWGSSVKFRFGNPKGYDADGNEIHVPRCEKCGCYKSQVIGKECFTWICTFCPVQQE